MKNTTLIITILACCLVYSIYQTQQNQKTNDKKTTSHKRLTTAVQNTKSVETLNKEIHETQLSENKIKNLEDNLDPSYLEFAYARDLATMDMINNEYNAFVATEFNAESTYTISEDQLDERQAQKLYASEMLKAQDEEASEELDWDMYISLNETYE